jgi:hypothetical protein
MTEPNAWQFRDQRIPARVFYLLKQGKITTTDLLLLCVIDALVTPHGDEKGKGCFARNRYLAKAINVHPTYVAQRISVLQEMGMVLVVRINDIRYLELEWSRTAEERSDMTHKYGKLLRQEYLQTVKRLEATDEKLKESEVAPKPLEKPKGKADPLCLPKGGALGKHKALSNTDKKEKTSLCRAAQGGDDKGALPCFSFGEDQSPKSEEARADLDCAKKLFKAVGAKGDVSLARSSASNWAKEFQKLRQCAKGGSAAIVEALDWYIANMGKPDKGIPEIYCGRSFREKYQKLCNAMKRHGHTSQFQQAPEELTTRTVKKKLRDGSTVSSTVKEWVRYDKTGEVISRRSADEE